MHLTRIRMGNVKDFLQFVQEAVPIKLKAIHVLNSVYFIDKILGLVKPFMKKELFKLVCLLCYSVFFFKLVFLVDTFPSTRDGYGGVLSTNSARMST